MQYYEEIVLLNTSTSVKKTLKNLINKSPLPLDDQEKENIKYNHQQKKNKSAGAFLGRR
jgi:hypothetical protein